MSGLKAKKTNRIHIKKNAVGNYPVACLINDEKGEVTIMYLVNVDPEKCTGCGACVDICPVEYLAIVDDVCEPVGDECQGCESCVAVCPEDAISVQEL